MREMEDKLLAKSLHVTLSVVCQQRCEAAAFDSLGERFGRNTSPFTKGWKPVVTDNADVTPRVCSHTGTAHDERHSNAPFPHASFATIQAAIAPAAARA